MYTHLVTCDFRLLMAWMWLRPSTLAMVKVPTRQVFFINMLWARESFSMEISVIYYANVMDKLIIDFENYCYKQSLESCWNRLLIVGRVIHDLSTNRRMLFCWAGISFWEKFISTLDNVPHKVKSIWGTLSLLILRTVWWWSNLESSGTACGVM